MKYKAGDKVPREFFTIDNESEADLWVFGCDVEVEGCSIKCLTPGPVFDDLGISKSTTLKMSNFSIKGVCKEKTTLVRTDGEVIFEGREWTQ